MVVSFKETLTICALATSPPLRMASATSPAFAKTNADAALFVTNDDQRAEAKTASAFHDFGGAIDENNLLGQFGRRLCHRLPAASVTAARSATAPRPADRHRQPPSTATGATRPPAAGCAAFDRR